MSERLCVIMPVYNESEAIGAVLEKWNAALSMLGIDYEIRPYNDGSKDDSLQVMRRVALRLKSVSVRDKPNGGHGNTILTGYREAAADGFDWVFQVDSDDEMGPEKFNELWSRRNDFDFLIGMREGRVQAWPRKIISFVSRLCVRLFYGKSIWDVNAPYRLMRVSVFKPFYKEIPLTTFAPNVILSGLAARYKLRSFETRVPQHNRRTGEVSIKKWRLLKAAAKSFWQTIIFAIAPNKNLASRGGNSAKLFSMLIGVFLVTSFVVAGNPLYDFAPVDCSVFKYIGKGVMNGGVPYKDMFDHKGPLLYLINYMGVSICDGLEGIWLIIVILRGVAVCAIGFALHKLFSLREVVAALVSFLCVMVYLDSAGNMTETYAMVLILLNLAVAVCSLFNNNLSKSACFVSGMVFGGITLLRPNMFGISGAIAVFVVVESMRLRSIKYFIESVVLGSVGAILVIAPFIVYYWLNNAIVDLYDCYLRYNFAYTFGAQHAGFKLSIELIGAILFILIGVFAYFQSCGDKRMRRILLFNLVFQLLSTGFVLTRTIRPHYFLPILPSCVIPLAWLYAHLNSKAYLISALSLLVCLPAGAARLYLKGYKIRDIVAEHVYSQLLTRDVLRISEKDDILKLSHFINDRHSVWVLGDPYVYHVLNVDTNEKYFFQPPVREYCGFSINEVIRKSLEKRNNEFIILAPIDIRYTTCPWQDTLVANYRRVAESGRFQLFVRK